MKIITVKIKSAHIKDGEQPLYETVEEIIEAFPNTSEDELASLRRMISDNLIGWVKQESFNKDNPVFIQVYNWEKGVILQ